MRSAFLSQSPDVKLPSFASCVSDQVTLFCCGAIVALIVITVAREKMQAAAFEQLVDERSNRAAN